MTQQAEILKNVRETLQTAQTKASERLTSLNGDAKKVIGSLVEKGKSQQQDLAGRVGKLQEEFLKGEMLKKVEATGRAQAGTVAGNLRKLADRLEKFSHPSAQAQA